MNVAPDTMTKGDFAAHIGVSPGRISQYIAQGSLSGDALDGDGRKARIRTSVAIEQLRRTLDPNQRFGANGAALRGVPPAVSTTKPTSQPDPSDEPKTKMPSAPPLMPNPQADELAELRLRQERVKAERLEREADLDVGRYMLTEDARREMAKAIASAFGVMEQGLQDMAMALAEQFGIPQRDAQHALVKSFRAVRANAVIGFRAEAEALPDHVEDGSE